jgi:outer membrane protein TolC
MIGGCTAAHYRTETDKVASDIIAKKQMDALGKKEPFTIEPAADTLRRRLLLNQKLPVAGPASYGSDKVPKIAHWPEKKTPPVAAGSDYPITVPVADNESVKLTLLDTLQVAARNNRDYQSSKEDIFRATLNLELETHAFQTTFAGALQSLYTSDQSGGVPVGGFTNSATPSVTKMFENGAAVTANLALDLVKLLTGDRGSSLGILADATISIPLLRGSGRDIVTEPMTQAERNVVYSIWTFERFKRTLAVQVASEYLSVLQSLDQVKNEAENYRGLVTASRRARRLADAGRLSEIQVDQAKQSELSARNRWISTQQRYEQQLDSFRVTLGLPTDANVELDRAELDHLAEAAKDRMGENAKVEELDAAIQAQVPMAADTPVTLVPPSRTGGGPLEMDVQEAVKIALATRLDLRAAQGQVVDAQRGVVVAADALGAGLKLTFSGSAGEGRSLASADQPNARVRLDRGVYSAGALLDLPLDRTQESITYRNSYIAMERAVRNMQSLEDQVKLSVRNDLRTLVQVRESFKIQAMALTVAERQVKSIQLFLEAGRAEMRDLLDAQTSLITAQNGLSQALVSYRVTELTLQRDMDVLDVNEKGLWREYKPEQHAK